VWTERRRSGILAAMRRALAFALWLFAACSPTLPEDRFACRTDEDCPEEMVCRTARGRCFFTPADAGR
jgi:hypothetical protein